MSFTPQNVITTARYVLNDTDATDPRATDTELLLYVNDGVREISALNPGLFTTIGDLVCAVSTVEQALAFSSAQAFVRVVCIHGGAAVTEFDAAAMDQFTPGWRTDTAGAARQWSRSSDPLRFYIYPKAPATSQTLDVEYVKIPTSLAISDTVTELPDAYKAALVDYCVYRAESKDDEHVNSGRATASYNAFVAKIKG